MKRLAGYTLFELLIVLLIFALLAGIATPRLINMYDSAQAAYARDDVLNRVSGLSYRAFQQAKGFELKAFPPPTDERVQLDSLSTIKRQDIPLELPPGWQLEAKEPVQFFDNGACSGGKATLKYYQQHYEIEFIPPFCQVKLL